MAATTPRQRLLDTVVDAALETGIGDKSLRAIAESVGTSHRMLIHHFGSRDGLLTEVVKAVEERQRTVLATSATGTVEPLDTARAFWNQLCAPEFAPQERLFFEVYGQALQGKPWAEPLLEGVIGDWLGPLTGLMTAIGADPEQAPVRARVALAVTRGLLLDLLTTQEKEAVDAAMELFTQVFLAPLQAARQTEIGDRQG